MEDEKIAIFDQYLALSIGNDTTYSHGYYGKRIGTVLKLSLVPFSMILSDP